MKRIALSNLLYLPFILVGCSQESYAIATPPYGDTSGGDSDSDSDGEEGDSDGGVVPSDSGACIPLWVSECQGDSVVNKDTACGEMPYLLQTCSGFCENGGCYGMGEGGGSDIDPSCVADYVPTCVGYSAMLLEKECGLAPIEVAECEDGCEEGMCSQYSPDDEPPTLKCVGSDVMWVHPTLEDELVEECQYGCENAACLPDSCPNKVAYRDCVGSDVMWHDSCGKPASLVESCEFGCNKGECSPDPSVVTKVVAFKPNALTHLCPFHTGGDTEFGGHGPRVEISTDLFTEGNTLYAHVWFEAKETVPDFTAGIYDSMHAIYTPEYGCVIDGVEGGTNSSASYVDTNHELDILFPAPNGPVSRFEVMGDSKGDDIDECGTKDMWANVVFNKIRVRVTCS